MSEGYPAEGNERSLSPGKRRRKFYEPEAEALGDQQRRLEKDQSERSEEDWRMMHGRKIRPGIRPYLRGVRRWGPGLTSRQIRRNKVRTARSWGRMLKAMEDTGMTMEEFVETLSPEELVRGKLKDSKGGFRGRPPSWVPRDFHRACIRELMRRGTDLWRKNYLEAVEALTEIATDPEADPRDRMKAAIYVIERIEGKIPEKLEVTGEAPWQVIIQEIVAEVPDSAIEKARVGALEASEILEAEIVEEEAAPARRRRRRA